MNTEYCNEILNVKGNLCTYKDDKNNFMMTNAGKPFIMLAPQLGGEKRYILETKPFGKCPFCKKHDTNIFILEGEYNLINCGKGGGFVRK